MEFVNSQDKSACLSLACLFLPRAFPLSTFTFSHLQQRDPPHYYFNPALWPNHSGSIPHWFFAILISFDVFPPFTVQPYQ